MCSTDNHQMNGLFIRSRSSTKHVFQYGHRIFVTCLAPPSYDAPRSPTQYRLISFSVRTRQHEPRSIAQCGAQSPINGAGWRRDSTGTRAAAAAPGACNRIERAAGRRARGARVSQDRSGLFVRLCGVSCGRTQTARLIERRRAVRAEWPTAAWTKCRYGALP